MSYLLLVDDDEDFTIPVAIMLRDAGYEVHIEMDLESAEKSMKARRPDLIILDVMFPENNLGGFEFCRKMRHFNEKIKNIPILMLTAVNAKFPLRFSSIDIDDTWLPIDDFLEKPVDFDILRNKVTKMLSYTD